MPGLVPGIHVLLFEQKVVDGRTSPAMTERKSKQAVWKIR